MADIEKTGRSDDLSSTMTATDRGFYRYLVEHGSASRAAIASAIGISRPTASESAQRLLNWGVIREAGQRNGQRGRIPLLYDVRAKRGHTLALAMDHDWIGLRVSDFAANVLWERVEDLARGVDREQLVGRAHRLLAASQRHAVGECLAAAVSVADPVDPTTGHVISLPNSPFPAGHLRVRDRILQIDERRLCIDNDVNWAAFAESRDGSMMGVPNFLYVHIGAGIGAALFLNGRLYRGATGMSGEIGYTQVAPGESLMQHLVTLGVASSDDCSIDVQAVADMLTEQPNSERVHAIVRVLAWAITNTAIALNPGAIVLAGVLMAYPAFCDGLRAAIEKHILAPITIQAGSFGTLAPLAGASRGAHERACACLGL